MKNLNDVVSVFFVLFIIFIVSDLIFKTHIIKEFKDLFGFWIVLLLGLALIVFVVGSIFGILKFGWNQL